MFKLDFLKEHAELSKILCPTCLKEDKKVQTYLLDRGNTLQCSEHKEHYFTLEDLLEFKLKTL